MDNPNLFLIKSPFDLPPSCCHRFNNAKNAIFQKPHRFHPPYSGDASHARLYMVDQGDFMLWSLDIGRCCHNERHCNWISKGEGISIAVYTDNKLRIWTRLHWNVLCGYKKDIGKLLFHAGEFKTHHRQHFDEPLFGLSPLAFAKTPPF